MNKMRQLTKNRNHKKKKKRNPRTKDYNMSELKNSMESFKSRLNHTEVGISKIILLQELKERRLKKAYGPMG